MPKGSESSLACKTSPQLESLVWNSAVSKFVAQECITFIATKCLEVRLPDARTQSDCRWLDSVTLASLAWKPGDEANISKVQG